MPIVLVILFSFNSSRSLQNFEGFSLRWYETFFESESLRDSLIASIEIALVTMVIACSARSWRMGSYALGHAGRTPPTS